MIYLSPRSSRFSFRPHHHALMIVGFLAILFAGYVIFQGREVFFGPQLTLNEPSNGALVFGKVLVRGHTEPHIKVSINEFESMSNENGYFEEYLPLAKGLHVIEVKVKNRFNKEARVVRQVVVR